MPLITLESINPSEICKGGSIQLAFNVSVKPFSDGNVFVIRANGPVSQILGEVSGSATGEYTFNCAMPANFTQGVYSISVEASYFNVLEVSNPIDLTIDAKPIVYDVLGGGNYCLGSAGHEIYLSSSETGVNYQLYRTFENQTEPIGSPVSGTDNSISFGYFTLNGQYSVKAVNFDTQCESTMNGSASIITAPNPTSYNVVGGGNYCEGSNGVQIGLDGSQSLVEYTLKAGEEIVATKMGNGRPFYFDNFFTSNGRYTVSAYNTSTGCSSIMSNYVEVEAYPSPAEFTVSGGGTNCESVRYVNIDLSGSEIGIVYKLYNNGEHVEGADIIGTGDIIRFVQPNIPGVYSVSAENAGCMIFMSSSATVEIIPSPQVYTLSSPTNGHYCEGTPSGTQINVSGSQVGVIYELLLDGEFLTSAEGSGQAFVFLNVTIEGNYTIRALDPNTTCFSYMNGTVEVVKDALTAPVDGLPIGTNVEVSPTLFSWSLVDCAESYGLMISTKSRHEQSGL